MISKAVRDAVNGRLDDAYPAVVKRNITNMSDTRLPPRTTTSVWVSIEFPSSEEDIASEGDPDNNLWREEGTFQVHIFVPTGTGDEVASQWAEDVYELYRGQTFDGVECFGRMASEQGDRWNGNWWGISYGIPFRYDRTP